MHYREFYYWCRDAVRGIKYIPDKNKVYNELFDHLLDRYEGYIARGISEQEAVQRTLNAMGDAKALAPQLASIHKPYWAYAMVFTRFIVLVLICLVIGRGIVFVHDQNYYTKNPLGNPFSDSEKIMISYVRPDVKDVADGYTFCVTEAGLWDYGAIIRLKVTNPIPWSMEQTAVLYMEGRDSVGQVYTCHALRGSKTSNSVCAISEQKGLTTYIYDLYLYGDCEEVQWFELQYNRDGRDILLRIDFPRGE